LCETNNSSAKSRNPAHFVPHKVAWPCPQLPATCPSPEPYQPSPHPPILFLSDPFPVVQYIYFCIIQVVFFYRFPHQNPVCISLLPHTCYRPSTSDPSDVITLIIFDIHYKSCSSLLCCESKEDLFLCLQNYSINYWISEGVPPRKIVMGMPLYGQSFQLAEPSTNGLNARAPGPGQAGEFTRAAGFLAYYEVRCICLTVLVNR